LVLLFFIFGSSFFYFWFFFLSLFVSFHLVFFKKNIVYISCYFWQKSPFSHLCAASHRPNSKMEVVIYFLFIFSCSVICFCLFFLFGFMFFCFFLLGFMFLFVFSCSVLCFCLFFSARFYVLFVFFVSVFISTFFYFIGNSLYLKSVFYFQ